MHASVTSTQDGGEVRSALHSGRFLTAKRVVSASCKERTGTTLPELFQANYRAVSKIRRWPISLSPYVIQYSNPINRRYVVRVSDSVVK